MEQPPTFGLVGGLGIGAAVYYYEQLAKSAAPLHLAMVHADMQRALAHVRANEIPQLADYFASLIARLAAAGATFAALPAVTPHICIRELRDRSPLPLVSIVDEAARNIRARNLRRVALFGTRYTVESNLFGLLDGVVDIVRPRPDEIDTIHRTYFELVDAAAGGPKQRDAFTAIARALQDREAVDAIVLAGTELALIFGEGADFPVVDCARLHLDAILARLTASAAPS